MIEVKVTTCTGCLGGGTWKRQELPLWTWAFKLDTLHPYIHLLSTGSGSRTSSGQWTPTRAFIYGVTTFQIIAHRFCGDPEDKKPKTFHQPVELTRTHEASWTVHLLSSGDYHFLPDTVAHVVQTKDNSSDILPKKSCRKYSDLGQRLMKIKRHQHQLASPYPPASTHISL